jgi:ribulose-phosphate 3-epimerase
MLVAPSILSADFGHLADDVKAVCDAGADLIHVDIMDGHFVPNMTMGPMIIEAVAKVATKPLDVHLMVENNSFFVDLYAPLKPEFITFHIEEEKHPHRLIQKIKDLGIKAGVVLNPHSSPELIRYLLPDLDIVLLMSVNPGFGGQKFLPSVIQKSAEIAKMRAKCNSKALIEVDGGVNDKNIVELKNAGVDVVVAGNFVFKSGDYAKAIAALKA